MGQELFLRNKISRQIKQNGSSYVFKRYGVDEYGQYVDEIETEFSIEGLFHETVNHVTITESDAARIIDIPKSYILCLFEDGEPINIDDFVEINKKVYKVTGKTNVGNYNIAYDISMELQINGNQT